MPDKFSILKPECAQTRRLFHLAFVEPAAEDEIMLHAAGCLECMDAFLELKDTVRQLETAAVGIPEPGDFSSRVFAAIDAEEARARKRFRTMIVAAVAFFAGIALTLAVTLPLSGGGSKGGAEPAAGSGKTDGPPEAGGAKGDPVSGPKTEHAHEEHRIPDFNGLQPGDDPPPEKDSLNKILESISEIQKEPQEGRPGSRGRRGGMMRSLMHRISLLGPGERAELIEKLEKGPVSGRPVMEKHFRAQLIERIKALPDKPLRHPDHYRPGSSKNSGN